MGDQEAVAAALSALGVGSLRTTLTDLGTRGRISHAGSLLLEVEGRQLRDVDGSPPSLISVVYMRAGYTPGDYPSEVEWTGRRVMEVSNSVLCPPVVYQLAGCKKVQQELALPGGVERFLPPADAALLRTCFAGLWPAAGGGGDAAAAQSRALQSPSQFVLKPQREGGGNNLYGEALATALGEGPGALSPADRGGYILMQRITPTPFPAVLVRGGAPVTLPSCVTELGVYSGYVGVGGGAPVYDAVLGTLLRTKPAESDEGGVAAGYAVVDSLMLV